MENDIFSYPLGASVLNGIDVNPKQTNYFVKYSSSAIDSQKRFFQRLGIDELFDRRVMVAATFGTKTLTVQDLSFSGYQDPLTSKCSGFDGVIAVEPNIPILSGWSDCPWLMFAGKKTVGVVHAGRKTLDDFILDGFVDEFAKRERLSDLKIGVSPYIPAASFGHQNLNSLNRKTDWQNAQAITEREGLFYIDLQRMMIADLLRLGLREEQINDAQLSSYAMSEKSHALGGFAVSHRHAQATENSKEGRGAFCLMMKEGS